LQQNTYFKFYIDAFYVIVTQTENTPSTAAVDINSAAKSDAKVSHSIRNERKAQTIRSDV